MTDPIQRSDPKPSTWDSDDYDKPLPGAAQRSAANVANSPWLTEAAAARAAEARDAQPYPTAIFSNPAMFGPGVALAKPPPAAAPKPAALPAAPNARRGVTIATLADDLPKGTRTDASRAFTCGAGYKMFPEVAKQPDGKDAIVYWKAFNTEAKRVDFLVGPSALSTFTSAPSDYATAAANAFMGEQDPATRESAKVVELAVTKGFGSAIAHLPAASKAAWTDPSWVAKTTFQTLSAIGPATEGAAQARLGARARAAEQAVGEVGANGFIAHVNDDLPLGKTDGTRLRNCGNCAIATDASLSGAPASALPGDLTPTTTLSDYYGNSWSSPMTPSDIETEMKKAGGNARGIVFGDIPDRDVGHFFNVVSDDGVVRFVDGQTGAAARLGDFKRFWLLRTN